jgi:hypothetical protein
VFKPSTSFRLIMALAMLLVALAGSTASAQRPGTTVVDEGVYESELTGLEISYSDDWIFTGADVSDEDDLIELDSDLGFVRTGFASLDESAEEGRDEFLATVSEDVANLEIIDEGTNRVLSWALASVEVGTGEELVIYVEVVEDFVDDIKLVTLLVAAEDNFVELYDLAYQTITVDDDPILDQFDADDIADMLGTIPGTAGDQDMTPVVDEDESETGRAGSDRDSAAEADSYVFEMEDIELVVTGDVDINDIQFEEDTYEQVLLVGVGSIGAVSVIVSPFDAESTLEGFIDGFMSEMEDSVEIDNGFDDGVAWTLYEASISGLEMYVYATVNDDQYDSHYLELIAAPVAFFEDEFLMFQDSVEVNGEGMFQDIDIDDLLDIIGL